MDSKNHTNLKDYEKKLTKAFAMQALSRPNQRTDVTGIAIPSEYDVEVAREWCQENQK